MDKDCGNIYLNARRAAGYTQERWAEMIGMSVDVVRLYEAGKNLPSDEVVTRMAAVSGTPILCWWHMLRKSGIANDLLPEVETLPLSQAVLRLLGQIRAFSKNNFGDDLMAMAEDGHVDELEAEGFERILAALDGIVKAAISLRYAKRDGEATR